MLKPGSKAPSFELMSDEGKKVSLKDFAGKKVVLYFYPRDNTPGCTKEACSFSENSQRLKKAGAVVIGISADSVASHQKFKEKYNLGFPLLSDPDKEVIEKYGVWKEKSMYGKKMMGIERTTFIIDEQGKIAHVFPKVKVDGHTEEVLKAL
jgi:thioredoxin-dependent peroxiredoxin